MRVRQPKIERGPGAPSLCAETVFPPLGLAPAPLALPLEPWCRTLRPCRTVRCEAAIDAFWPRVMIRSYAAWPAFPPPSRWNSASAISVSASAPEARALAALDVLDGRGDVDDFFPPVQRIVEPLVQ